MRRAAFTILLLTVAGCSDDGGGTDATVTPDRVNPDLCANVDCTTEADQCNSAACDSATGACVLTPLNEGGDCDDGQVCTSGDTCQAGVCTGAAMDCSAAADSCNTAQCNPGTGTCQRTPINEGMPCDDNDMCTSIGTCNMGTCEGVEEVGCDDIGGGVCATGMCDPATGCMPVAGMNGMPCDDGMFCSGADMCVGAICTGGADICMGAIYVSDFEMDDGMLIHQTPWEHGEPMNTFISGASGGTQAWVTDLNGDYIGNSEAVLQSRSFDFSTLTTDPILRFDLIYRFASADEFYVEISTNTGVTWTRLGTGATGTNWYNDAPNRWWDGTSGAAGVWETAEHPLTGTAGEADVRFRFHLSTSASGNDEGVGIDNVLIIPGV